MGITGIGVGVGVGPFSLDANDLYSLGPQGASLTLTGGDVALIAPLVAEGASLTLSGGAVAFARELNPAGNSLTMTGGAASLGAATHIAFDGSSGCQATAPDSAALDLTGDIEIRYALNLPDWSPTTEGTVLVKGLNYRTVVRTNGFLRFTIPGGADFDSSAPGFTDGQLYLVRILFDKDNGASQSTATFYYKSGVGVGSVASEIASDTGWTTISTATHGATLSPSANTSSLVLGELSASRLVGDLYHVRIYDGIGGTVVFDADPTVASPGDSTFTESSSNAATVTLAGTAALE